MPNIRMHRVQSVPVESLIETIGFEQLSVTVFGKTHPQPRLVAWYGPCSYTYSGLTLPSRPLPAVLQNLMAQAQRLVGERFDSVMCNLYRDGADNVGWHSDNEPEFGGDPTIASMSFGATRRFALREGSSGSTNQAWDLTDGSVLVMGKGVQPKYQHRITPTRRPCGPRVNLTFRRTV